LGNHQFITIQQSDKIFVIEVEPFLYITCWNKELKNQFRTQQVSLCN
jgi:hypothetical protein